MRSFWVAVSFGFVTTALGGQRSEEAPIMLMGIWQVVGHQVVQGERQIFVQLDRLGPIPRGHHYVLPDIKEVREWRRLEEEERMARAQWNPSPRLQAERAKLREMLARAAQGQGDEED